MNPPLLAGSPSRPSAAEVAELDAALLSAGNATDTQALIGPWRCGRCGDLLETVLLRLRHKWDHESERTLLPLTLGAERQELVL